MATRIATGGVIEVHEPVGDPRQLITLALEKAADPAVLSKLLEVQQEWDAMQSRKAYVEAMTQYKRTAPPVLARDARVDFPTSKGRVKYTHCTLGSIIQTITGGLSAHGLSVSWSTEQPAAGAVRVTCHITHRQGHRESTALTGPPDDSGSKNRLQQIGSAVTYLQRYTLLAALGLATADQDDADQPTPAALDAWTPADPASLPTLEELSEKHYQTVEEAKDAPSGGTEAAVSSAADTDRPDTDAAADELFLEHGSKANTWRIKIMQTSSQGTLRSIRAAVQQDVDIDDEHRAALLRQVKERAEWCKKMAESKAEALR